MEQAIYDACLVVSKSPRLGRSRPYLTARALRFRTLTRHPSYTLVYRPEAVPIEIIAVLHGKREFQRVLKQR